MQTVVTLGESLVDFVPFGLGEGLVYAEIEAHSAAGWPLPAFQPAPGGAPANVAACVARLGGRAAFVGLRGDDPFGAALERTLRECGVDTRYYRATERAKTGLAFVTLNVQGDRSFWFYRDPSADMLLAPEDVPLDFIAEAGILHVGGVSLAGGPCREATLFAAREAKRRGVFVSYDPNWRPVLWPNPDEGAEVLRRVFPHCDLVKVNREELRQLAGTDSPREGARRFHAQGIRVVLVTLDKDGCYFSVQDDSLGRSYDGWVPGIAVQPVDTTGAGDTFIGSFLYQYAGREKAFAWEADTVRAWAEFSVAASALVTTRRGAIPALPSRQEVESFAAASV